MLKHFNVRTDEFNVYMQERGYHFYLFIFSLLFTIIIIISFFVFIFFFLKKTFIIYLVFKQNN